MSYSFLLWCSIFQIYQQFNAETVLSVIGHQYQHLLLCMKCGLALNAPVHVNDARVLATYFPVSFFFLSPGVGRGEKRPWEQGWSSHSFQPALLRARVPVLCLEIRKSFQWFLHPFPSKLLFTVIYISGHVCSGSLMESSLHMDKHVR